MSSEAKSVNDAAKVFKAGGISLIGKVGGRAIHVITQALIARYLGPATFGVYAIGWITIDMLGTVGMLGLNRGAVRFIGQLDDKASPIQIIYQSILTSAIVASFCVLVLSFLSGPIATWYGEPALQNVLLIFAPAILGTVIMRVTSAITTLTHKIQYTVLIEDVAQPVINLTVIGGIVLFFSLSLQNTVVSSLMSLVSGALLGLYFNWKLFFGGKTNANISFKNVINPELIRFSVIASIAGSLTIFIGKMDKLIIGVLLSSEDVGLYQASGQLTIVFAVIIGSMTGIFAPLVTKLYAQNQTERLGRLYSSVNKVILYASIPIFILLFIFAEEIMELVYGSQYSGSYYLLKLHSMAQMVNVLSGPIAPLLIMTGHQKHWLITAFAAFAFNVICNIVLIGMFGIVGSVITLGITMLILTVVGLTLAHRKLGVVPFNRRFLKGVVVGIVLGFVLWAFKIALHPNTALELIGVSVLSFGFFLVGLFILGIDPEDKYLLEAAKSKFAR